MKILQTACGNINEAYIENRFTDGVNIIFSNDNNKGKTIVGGGDSISAINNLNLASKIYHISTGGGASMQLIGGEILPGVDVISEK